MMRWVMVLVAIMILTINADKDTKLNTWYITVNIWKTQYSNLNTAHCISNNDSRGDDEHKRHTISGRTQVLWSGTIQQLRDQSLDICSRAPCWNLTSCGIQKTFHRLLGFVSEIPHPQEIKTQLLDFPVGKNRYIILFQPKKTWFLNSHGTITKNQSKT